MTASPGSEKERMEEVCDNLSIEKIEYRNEEDIDVKPYINPIDTTWKWFTIPQEYKYISSSLRAMLEEKLQFLIKRGLLRKKHPKWIFKSDLLKLGEEIQYKINITMEELRGPLYVSLDATVISSYTYVLCRTYRKPRISIIESFSREN